jgi:hypothetical protein
MMFVVKTIQQLEDAIIKNAEEVMIVGRQATEILEEISRPTAEAGLNTLYPMLSRLNDRFEVLKLIDNSQIVEGILRKKPILS